MKFDVIYASSREELEEQIAAKVAQGWEAQGEPEIVHANVEPNVMDMIYHYQVVTKHDDETQPKRTLGEMEGDLANAIFNPKPQE